MKFLIVLITFISSTSIFLSAEIRHYETIIYTDDIWHYMPGTSEPDANWRELSFDDSGWLLGAGGIGYGDDDDNTVISLVPSVYLRHVFEILDMSRIESVLLHMDYDDAFVAYLNGVEVARAGITGNYPSFNELGVNHEAVLKDGLVPQEFVLSPELVQSSLQLGDNVLAIQVHNSSASSSDMSAIAFLSVGVNDDVNVYRPTPSWFAAPFVFTSSNLPIVSIETENGAGIVDEPKTKAHMKIIHTPGLRNQLSDPGNIYDGNVGIEVRGSYSSRLPQKPYGFETRDILEENLNVSLLDMPKENDWILLANYNDKVFMRNSLPFHLFQKMGHYAPRTRLCEVSLNGSYDGIYLLTEKIKRDKNRVDISKLDLDDNAGDSITGGYIFKVDYFTSTDSWVGDYEPIDNPGASVHYVYSYPKADEITEPQKSYLKDYVHAFESTLYGTDFNHEENGYRAYLDVTSFLDYFIITELSRNVDGYKKSRNYFKDKESKGGLIHSGPVWDFDWAWKDLIDGCQTFSATDGSGWAYTIGECNPRPDPSGWMVKLMEDPSFVEQLGNRYWGLRRTILSDDYLGQYIDSVHVLVDEAQSRHYTRWSILGRNVGAPESGVQPQTYDGEVDKFKNWIDLRLAWLDNNMPEESIGNSIPALSIEPIVLRVFPNPTTDYVFVETDQQIQRVELFNALGQLVNRLEASGRYSVKLNLSTCRPGLHVVKVTLQNKESHFTRLLIK